MKRSRFGYVVWMLALGSSAFAAETSSVVAPHARLQRLSGGLSFTEGPAVDAAGNVFFTDQPNDQILKWSTDGTLSVFLSPCGRSNGLFFDKEGTLWACADLNNELWRIDQQGNVTVVVDNYKGRKLNGPNDLWITRDGGIYFTDPFYQRSYWTRGPSELGGRLVFYLSPDQQTLTRVATGLEQPNGIIGTPDERYVYVADIGAGKTYRYKILPDATLSEKTLFCNMGSDGMTLDEEGNLYLTGAGVTVFNKHGKQIEKIDVPSSWTANVTFGGRDRKTLFITARDTLYAMDMRVRGASLVPDYDHDERVAFLDYAHLAGLWNQSDSSVDLGPTVFGDGSIDMRDLARFSSYWLDEVLPVELTAYWKLDETEGDTAVDCAAGNDATLVGDILWETEGGLHKGALRLNGANSFLRAPALLNPAETVFSVFAWVKGGGPGQVILSQAEGADWLRLDALGRLQSTLKYTRRASDLTSDVSIANDTWHRVGFSWDGSDRVLYIDDVEVARDTQATLQGAKGKLQLGAGKDLESGTFWSGLIDEVRLYDEPWKPQK